MPGGNKARAMGLNHIALEVGNIDEALAFYGRLFDFELRGRSESSAFIDLGDQFLALQTGRRQAADDGRPFRPRRRRQGCRPPCASGGGRSGATRAIPDFLDPWGNRIEIVAYDNVQFTKAQNVLRGMGLTHLRKNDEAIKELAQKGMMNRAA